MKRIFLFLLVLVSILGSLYVGGYSIGYVITKECVTRGKFHLGDSVFMCRRSTNPKADSLLRDINCEHDRIS